MQHERVHRAHSDDGTEIVGRVYGQGPPLVLVHGAIADGESEWGEVLPLLAEHFTCFTPSTRGRGLSDHHPDVSRAARVADVRAFIESLGEPVGLVGTSGGGMISLGVAARTSALTSLALYEPVVFEVASDERLAVLRQAIEEMTTAAADGRPDDAIAAFAATIANERELSALDADPESVAEAARYLEVDIEELREAYRFEGPSPTDPASLERIEVPVFLLCGAGTPTPWFAEGSRFVADHVREATLREIPEVGHFGFLTDPERLAPELIGFFANAYHPA